jgi:hypothetical protein
MQTGYKVNGCSTQAELISESRAVLAARDSKIGICQASALNLCQALPTSKQLNLKKFSDADGIQSQWLLDTGRTDF